VQSAATADLQNADDAVCMIEKAGCSLLTRRKYE
jgi:hypothetical protein